MSERLTPEAAASLAEQAKGKPVLYHGEIIGWIRSCRATEQGIEVHVEAVDDRCKEILAGYYPFIMGITLPESTDE